MKIKYFESKILLRKRVCRSSKKHTYVILANVKKVYRSDKFHNQSEKKSLSRGIKSFKLAFTPNVYDFS